MSYKETRLTVRPDTSAPFWDYPAELKNHISVTYVDPGLRESLDILVSEDGLTRTINVTWKDLEAQTVFCSDPKVIQGFIDREQYNYINRIISYMV